MGSLFELGRQKVRKGASLLRAFIKASVTVALTSAISFATSASAQTPAPPESAVAVSEAHPAGADGSTAPPAATDSVGASGQSASGAASQANNNRYRDGMVIWETPADAPVPFLLKFNINTQLRYLNTQNSDETFTDHLGVSREVNNRNDITVNLSLIHI